MHDLLYHHHHHHHLPPASFASLFAPRPLRTTSSVTGVAPLDDAEDDDDDGIVRGSRAGAA